MSSELKWKVRLLEQVREADRLVVWDHAYDRGSDEPQRVNHFEVNDPAEVSDLLARIDIDEPASTGHCMCTGSPHVDFMVGSEVVATLSLHHGVRLRWEGVWPADAELTRASAFDVCGWFKERGISGPWIELRGQVDRSLAYQRRTMKIRNILPTELADRFLRIQDQGEAIDLFRSAEQDEAVLAGWCLRILGCDNSSWDHIDQVTRADELATKVMPMLGQEACGSALQAHAIVQPDRDACYGAGRVLFFFGGWENFTRESLNECLPVLAPISLRHPRKRNRQMVMWALSKIEGGDDPLRWVLNGNVTPESIPSDLASEPDGNVYSRELADNEPVDASDRAYAAWLLAELGITDVRDIVERLESGSSGSDQLTFRHALKAMGV